MNTQNSDSHNIKQGAVIGGWICFALGLAVMGYSLWLFFIYGPLLVVAFILAITAMSQKRIAGGITLLLLTLIVPPILWLCLTASRTGEAFNKVNRYLDAENKKHGINLIKLQPTEEVPAVIRSEPRQNFQNNDKEKKPTPDPLASEREAINKIFDQRLSDAHAWNIYIAHTKIMTANIMRNPPPIFSGDGESIMYLQQQGQSTLIVAASLRDHSVISTWTPAEEPRSFAWSQDGKRVAYRTRRGLHVMDWLTKNDVFVPVPGYFGAADDMLGWIGADKLITISRINGGKSTLDLDLLKLDDPGFSNDPVIRQRQMDDVFIGPRAHQYSKIFRSEYRGVKSINPSLYAGEIDNTYSHVLLHNFYGSTPYLVSPDLRHVLVFGENQNTHYYLGAREAQAMKFRVDLNNMKLLNAGNSDAIMRYIKKGVPFHGQIYSPLTNPLNGKLTGPNPRSLKGFVKVSEWRDSYIIVTVESELEQAMPGDIVTEITSDNWEYTDQCIMFYKSMWFPLKALTEEENADSIENQNSTTVSVAATVDQEKNVKPDSMLPSTIEASERELNRVYRKLVSRLTITQRAQLKREEIAWIKKKDSLPFGSEAQKKMVDARTDELREMLSGS